MAPGRRWKINRLINCREKQNIEDVFIQQEKLEISQSRSKDEMSLPAVDRISELPDEILVSIISLLTLREANTTKILSTRWRRLDPFGNTISLNFPFPTQRGKGRFNGYVQIGDEANFSDHINEMKRELESYNYKGSRVIKLLRMDIPIPSPSLSYRKRYILNDYMDPHMMKAYSNYNCRKLIEFAVSMETETLYLSMVYDSLRDTVTNSFYEYDYIRATLEPLLYNDHRWSDLEEESIPFRPGLKSLKELSLIGVSLDGDDISLMLKNLVALERLSIDCPQICGSRVLSVAGYPSCKLKHLLLSNIAGHLSNFRIEVHDVVNLVSLKCDGLFDVHDLYLYNVPKLAHLRAFTATPCNDFVIGCKYYKYSKSQDKDKASFIHNDLHMYTRLRRLKHLELNNVVMGKESSTVQQLYPIIEAFPYLEKLEIKFERSLFEPKYNDQQSELRRKLYHEKVDSVDKLMMSRLNFHLETVRLTDFSGSVFEMEFVLFVIHNVVELQELIVEACVTDCSVQRKEIARSFQHLLSVTPSSVDLILK